MAELLGRLNSVEGIEWIRLMYLYPMHVTEELIDAITGCEKVIPYLDIPLQHAADGVLKRMNRRVDRAETDRLIDRLRERIEGLTLRTTMLTGFPGETEEEFEELLRFVRERKFERLGVFEFSPEPGTPAARMEGHCPADVAAERKKVKDRPNVAVIKQDNYARLRFDPEIVSDSEYTIQSLPENGTLTLVEPILTAVHQLIGTANPRQQQALLNNVILSGGGAMLDGLEQRLLRELAPIGGGRVTTVDDPLYAAATGALKVAHDLPHRYWKQLG